MPGKAAWLASFLPFEGERGPEVRVGAITDRDVPTCGLNDKVGDLVGFLHDRLDPGHPFESVRALPDGVLAPQVWLLGSSSHGGAVAAYLGLPFVFAHFITATFGPQVRTAC